jgi:TonB family protein
MKVANKLAVLLSLGAFVPFASAKSVEQSYLESCLKAPGVPVPTRVIAPDVEAGYIGDTVDVEFTVSATGKTSGFSVVSSPDSALSNAVLQAVKQWQFEPAQRDGVSVTTKVVLPVRIVDDATVGTHYAAN